MDRYNERKEEDVLVSNVLEDFSGEIIDLLRALQKEKASFSDLGIDFEEKAFYDILKMLAVKYDFGYPEQAHRSRQRCENSRRRQGHVHPLEPPR